MAPVSPEETSPEETSPEETSPEAAAVALLRGVGQRVTRPRVAVLSRVVAAGLDHVSADDVFDQVTALDADVHRATVYRTLDSLTEAGVLHHVHLDRGLRAYHLSESPLLHAAPVESHAAGTASGTTSPAGGSADGQSAGGPETLAGAAPDHAGPGHLLAHVHTHLHAQCSECGRVVDLPADVLGEAGTRIAEASGFVLDATHTALSGLCAACASAPDRPASPHHHGAEARGATAR